MSVVPSTLAEVDTEELAAAAAAGDSNALAQLYGRYADDVRRVAVLAVGGDRDVARDVSGDTWVAVGRSIRQYQYRPGCGFVAWLVTITRNKARDRYRKASTRREVLTPDLLELDSPDTADLPEEAAVRRERAREVVAAMQRLTRDQREVLIWLFWCNLSLTEVAAVMGRSQSAVSVLRHRALKAMARALPTGESDAGPVTWSRPQRRAAAAQRDAAGEAGTRC